MPPPAEQNGVFIQALRSRMLLRRKKSPTGSGLWTGFGQTNADALRVKFISLSLIESVQFDTLLQNAPQQPTKGARCRDRAPNNFLRTCKLGAPSRAEQGFTNAGWSIWI